MVDCVVGYSTLDIFTKFFLSMRNFAAFLILAFLSCVAWCAEPVTEFRVVLLQPDDVFRDRVSSVDALAKYIDAIGADIRASVAHATDKTPSGGFVVVAVRPGQRSKVWLDFDVPLSVDLQQDLINGIGRVFPVKVKNGPIAFALEIGVWGGKEPTRAKPNPQEWKAVDQRDWQTLDADELLDRVWHD